MFVRLSSRNNGPVTVISVFNCFLSIIAFYRKYFDTGPLYVTTCAMIAKIVSSIDFDRTISGRSLFYFMCCHGEKNKLYVSKNNFYKIKTIYFK